MIVCSGYQVQVIGEVDLLVAELGCIVGELFDRGILKEDLALAFMVGTIPVEELKNAEHETMMEEIKKAVNEIEEIKHTRCGDCAKHEDAPQCPHKREYEG